MTDYARVWIITGITTCLIFASEQGGMPKRMGPEDWAILIMLYALFIVFGPIGLVVYLMLL